MRKKITLMLALTLVFSILPMSVSASFNLALWNAVWSVVENTMFQETAATEDEPATYSPAYDIANTLAACPEFLPGVTDPGARDQAARMYVIENVVLEGLNVEITGNIATWSLVTE